ncbi:MAG TPA: hypothetical protein VFP71_10065, partial [Candidatus Angelobacter sp.]|nr:hypothetical protein [Candidatus Angelobacter sp.]
MKNQEQFLPKITRMHANQKSKLNLGRRACAELAEWNPYLRKKLRIMARTIFPKLTYCAAK